MTCNKPSTAVSAAHKRVNCYIVVLFQPISLLCQCRRHAAFLLFNFEEKNKKSTPWTPTVTTSVSAKCQRREDSLVQFDLI